ncbi:MAG: riboflavin synthase [Bacteroidetes bacterium]|nr:riboflavin synthase [Bacteroidota bacterium]
MFTGIIETTATVAVVGSTGTNKSFWIKSPLSPELKVDQSVAHDGVCLTVEDVRDGMHKVTAVLETLAKSSLGTWIVGSAVNIERCLQPSSRLDGHFVQGHVDTRGTVLEKTDLNGSWQFSFRFPVSFAPLLIEKGSVAVNGISLTVFNLGMDSFSVAIIPYTYEHTNLRYLKPGDEVNLEFDMLGKYIVRWAQTR